MPFGRRRLQNGALEFAGVLACVALAVKAVTGALVAWNAVMALNPAVLVGTAVVAALALIVDYWPEISSFFSDLWDKVQTGRLGQLTTGSVPRGPGCLLRSKLR